MEDRLSSLPDDLLLSILRDLPLKHAARTSALSRRWVPQWIRALADSPVLDFTDRDFAHGQPADRAAATVGRCLRLHAEHGAPLDAFRVALVSPPGPGYGAFGRDVIGWIAAAVARGAREVEVDLTPSQEGADHGSAAFLELPGDLFRSRSSLERLALGRLSLRAVPLPAAGLAGLRSLSLSHTDVTDEALRGVLATCRALESLSLRCCSLLTEVSVASERLRALELLGCRAVRDLRVAAPALESFAMYGDVILSAAAVDWYETVSVDFAAAPALRDVYLSHMDGCEDGDDYNCMDRVPYTYVNRDKFPYVDMPNLQELQLLLGCIQEEGDWNPRHPERVYTFFYSTSLPVLERLFIRLSRNPAKEVEDSDSDEDEDEYLSDRAVSRLLTFGLLTFIKVVNFRGTWRERRLIRYLLLRAPILEQLVLVTPEGGLGAPGFEHVEGIQEWVSARQKASREARTSVYRPSEDDSPNHAHTRIFNEEYCCMHQG
ncbi:hypothetical protein PAHAL_5G425900 [Panicum hallii]|uniref:F-box domain-containing protein n=1 Tax=Panicum hallii TaxID=206008 RepID=A0A2S3HWM9_9POAL|nr:hypothetical protein PAHAL_5G425900 [Panicum hallii]